MITTDVNSEQMCTAIQNLITMCGKDAKSFEADLTLQMIQTSLKLMLEGHDTGQLKLISRALKEMRHAYRIFNQYRGMQRISLFGSARTPEDHPDYIAAKQFSAGMAELDWMCITGAADGIMKAGLEGSTKKSSFGLSIRLPFESAQSVLEGDPKLIMFRYFFTRKLMFLTHSEAIAVFPGGFGTLDELFEVLTLIQTGKSSIVPIVLIEGSPGTYWKNWLDYVQGHLLSNGWICPCDQNLYYLAPSIPEAIQHIQQFYRRYHSYRYVKDILILRLKEELTEKQVDLLNQNFSDLITTGKMAMSPALSEETDHLNLPRLIFHHTRKDIGKVRALIDCINTL